MAFSVGEESIGDLEQFAPSSQLIPKSGQEMDEDEADGRVRDAPIEGGSEVVVKLLDLAQNLRGGPIAPLNSSQFDHQTA